MSVEGVPLEALPEETPSPVEAVGAEGDVEPLWFPEEDRPLGEQLFERQAQIRAGAAMTMADLQAQAVEEAREARRERAEEAKTDQTRINEARTAVSAQRRRYRELAARGKPPLTTTQQMGIVMNALAGFFGSPQSRGTYFKRGQQLVEQAARDWASKMAIERDLISVAGDEVDAAQDAHRQAEANHQAVLANIYKDLGERAKLLQSKAMGQQAQMEYEVASEQFKAMEAQAAAKAEGAQFDRALKMEEVGLKRAALEQKEIESRRQAALARRGQDITRRGQDIDLAKYRAAKEEAKREAEKTGTLVDPGKGGVRRPMFVSRFSGDRKQMIKDQERVNDFADAQDSFMEYHALIKKVSKSGRLYQGVGGERIRNNDERLLRAKHAELLEQTVKALTGATATEQQMERIGRIVPQVKGLSDAGTWDATKISRAYFDKLANEMENFLTSRAPPEMAREEVLAASPSRRWRAIKDEVAETRGDRLARTLADRNKKRRYTRYADYLRAMGAGRFTQDEARSLIDEVVKIAQSPGISEQERKTNAALARDLMKRYDKGQFAQSPGTLDRLIRFHEADARGDKKELKRLRAEQLGQKVPEVGQDVAEAWRQRR